MIYYAEVRFIVKSTLVFPYKKAAAASSCPCFRGDWLTDILPFITPINEMRNNCSMRIFGKRTLKFSLNYVKM